MRDSLTLLKNGTRTLRGIVRQALPDGDPRDAILDLILMAYRSTRDEIRAEAAAADRMAETAFGCECGPGECDHTLGEHLAMDPDVSDTSPVVRGTWVTVSHVIGLIADGWAWPDILRTHPELNEDDLKACLTHAVKAEAA